MKGKLSIMRSFSKISIPSTYNWSSENEFENVNFEDSPKKDKIE
jgi:hypothetical protein